MRKIILIRESPTYTLYRTVSNTFQTNTYILVSGNEALIVDPGFDKYHTDLVEDIVSLVLRFNCRRVILYITHGHLDHFCGDLTLRNRLISQGVDTTIMIHENDAYLLSDFKEHILIEHNIVPSYSLSIFQVKPHLPDIKVRDGDMVKVGNATFRVLHCPGHTRGSTILYNNELAFTGDVILDGGIGRVDLPHSDPSQMKLSVKRVVSELHPDTWILPGHGEPFYLKEQLHIILTLISEL